MSSVSSTDLLEIARAIADNLGWNFPADRLSELRRGLELAAADLSISPDELAFRLREQSWTQSQRDALTRHLSVGETYFWREPQTLDAFRTHVLPGLTQQLENTDASLFIWSAGCATGEEAYTLAILLLEAVPATRVKKIRILATDINPYFLNRAQEGVYGDWSFRNVPPWLQTRYFTQLPTGRYKVDARVRALVHFSQLNLADLHYPSPFSGPETISAIFCRNVLIYFEADQTAAMLERFQRSLKRGGWLLVSPSEIPIVSSGPFQRVWLPNVTIFRKGTPVEATRPAGITEFIRHTVKLPPAPRELPPPSLAPRELPPPPPARSAEENVTFNTEETDRLTAIRRAQRDANSGDHREALSRLASLIDLDPLDPELYYLRATIAWDAGDVSNAQDALRRALFLDPKFALAHFMMANLARSSGNLAEFERHLAQTRAILEQYEPETPVPHADGLSAAQLKTMVSALDTRETA